MKMSDALRAAADSAPVQDISVSTNSVRSRARRNRAVRVGANGILGVGAAALVFAGVAGVIANQTGVGAAETDGGMKAQDNPAGAPEPGFVGSDSMLACGYKFDLAAYPTGDVTAVATLGDVADSAVPVEVAYSGGADAFTVDVPGVFVIWNGLVVGNPGVADASTSTTVDPVVVSGNADLVNCWDGSALPAGDYTIVTVTSVTADVPPVDEPTAAPSVSPDPAASVDPNTSVSSDASGAATDVAVEPVTYAVSDAVAFTIAGDPAKDPFQQYLNPTDPGTANPNPNTPDDVLTSEEARTAYEAALSGKWDMAVGTQRVVLTGDSKDSDQNLWAKGYFGCPMEGTPSGFPSQSADLNWLGVKGDLPSGIHVSYGWVVDGNPLVHYAVKNNTDWSLPGFYQGSSPRLVLVKDGRVVAEAYPVNPNQNNVGIAYATDDGTAGGGDKLIYAPENGYLAPGDSQSGDYLWRDLSGCWTANGANTVAPGTYTVLSAQDLYLGNDYAVAYQSGRDAGGPAVDVAPAPAPDEALASAEPEPIMAPAPADSDSVSFTVWTSLGTLTVTN